MIYKRGFGVETDVTEKLSTFNQTTILQCVALHPKIFQRIYRCVVSH